MRLTTVGFFGLGFVLGARAGKERYEQIMEAARRSAEQLEAYGAGGTLARRLEGDGHDAGPAPRR